MNDLWRTINMKVVFYLLLLLHVVFHLIGFKKTVGPIRWISKQSLAWSCVFVMLLVAWTSLWLQWPFGWVAGLIGVASSQVLIFKYWKLAKWGTLGNVLFLFPVLYSLLQFLPNSFSNRYQREIIEGLAQPVQCPILTENDIEHLPKALQKYLRFTKSVGRPIVSRFKVEFEGEMKQKPEGNWLPIQAQQYTFWEVPERVFYIKSSLWGIPFDGLHLFKGPKATMQIKVASLFQVVDAKGPKMDQSETVTMFNDMCLASPSRLVQEDIVWKELDSLSLEAQFRHEGKTITAQLYFDAQGRLLNFVSKDRYLSADGVNYFCYTWSTPVSEYREFDVYYLPSYGEAIWQMPEGPFCYARFRTVEVKFNLLAKQDLLN